MPRVTPREIAEKQIRRSQAASEDYVKGVRNVEVAPTQQAKAKKAKLKNNFLQAVDSGKWEEGLDGVTLDDWKRAAEMKGGARYGQGVADAATKIEKFHEEFQPFVQGVKERINQMPDSTPDQRIAKMVENARAIAGFRRGRGRRA